MSIELIGESCKSFSIRGKSKAGCESNMQQGFGMGKSSGELSNRAGNDSIMQAPQPLVPWWPAAWQLLPKLLSTKLP
jgi:hypothetical protein